MNMTKQSGWRVVDLVTAAVLGVATGIIFIIWNQIGYLAFTSLDVFTAGLGGLVNGIWYLGGPLGGLIIRKPGAALFVEVVAATVSMALGSQWAIETLFSGIAQGLGAELIFALFLYRRFGAGVAALSGLGAATGAMILELFVGSTPNIAYAPIRLFTYWTTSSLSGIVLAGLLAWVLTRALAQTGVLDRFASGRELRRRV
ncbi:ECF transporter S component [Scrofimicrobium sp. R131]|uniref:ECF transporter S component n=1 Tax=Scrofimicrobium appendicitidis TaxID=3079930 RepID=A0AAU7V790_9ACTO